MIGSSVGAAVITCWAGVMGDAAAGMWGLKLDAESFRSSISSSKSGVLYEKVLKVPASFKRAILLLESWLKRYPHPASIFSYLLFAF